MSYEGPDRRVHRVIVTRNTEYHFRDGFCVAVRDRRTGDFLHGRMPTSLDGMSPKNPGLLAIQFRAGSLPGLYRPTVELIGGNAYQFTIEGVAR